MAPPVPIKMVFSYLGGRVDVAVGNNRDVGVGSLGHRLKRQILNIFPGQAGKAIIFKYFFNRKIYIINRQQRIPVYSRPNRPGKTKQSQTSSLNELELYLDLFGLMV
jgi:hypothetical protein